eukprot:1123972-Pelagomonas_calceolata.AAC.5
MFVCLRNRSRCSILAPATPNAAAVVRPDQPPGAAHDRNRPLRALHRAQEGRAGSAAGQPQSEGVRGQQALAR